MLNFELMIAMGSILGGTGAAISALIAWRTVRTSREALLRAYEQDKRHLWTEIKTLSAKAASIFRSIERVAADLELAYKTLFTFAGQATGSSRLNIYLNRIEEEISKARDSANNSNNIAVSFAQLSDLDYESAGDCRARLEASVIELSLALDLLKDELSGIERQNDQYRAQAIKPTPPQSPYGSGRISK